MPRIDWALACGLAFFDSYDKFFIRDDEGIGREIYQHRLAATE